MNSERCPWTGSSRYTFPMSRAAEAFALVDKRPAECFKVVLEMGEE